MPGLRVFDHFTVGEPAHFLADRFKRLIKSAGADGGVVARTYQFDQTRAVFGAVSRGNEPLGKTADSTRDPRPRQPDIRQAPPFAPAPGNAPRQHRQPPT